MGDRGQPAVLPEQGEVTLGPCTPLYLPATPETSGLPPRSPSRSRIPYLLTPICYLLSPISCVAAPLHSGILSISGWVHGPPASIALPIPINPSSIPSGPFTSNFTFLFLFILSSFFLNSSHLLTPHHYDFLPNVVESKTVFPSSHPARGGGTKTDLSPWPKSGPFPCPCRTHQPVITTFCQMS